MSIEKIKLQDIVAVAGYPGLYRIVGRSRTGIVVEAMDATKKRMSVALTTKVSVLSEIAMFSKHDDINLGVILLTIKENPITIPSKNASADELKKFMTIALPDYDESRVYQSHIQKLANWYSIIGDVLDYDDLKQINFPEKSKSEADVSADSPKSEEIQPEVKAKKIKKSSPTEDKE